MLYTATVTGVTARTVTRKRDNKTITIFDLVDSTGQTSSTSRRDLANEAQRLLNQPSDITVRVEQNGSFENRYLEDIRPATGQAQQQQPLPQPPPQQQQVQQQAPQQQQIVAEGEGTKKDWSIWRQTATKVAVHLSNTPQEFWFNVRQLMTFYASGLEPELPQQGVTSYAPAQQAQQSQQNQQNQYFTEESIANAPPVDGYPHSDDDIPF